jgi:ABC-type glycerol-3-phosphate transport system substrate-binding protein
MRKTSKVACALVAGALALAGCGGGNSGSAEDETAIEEIVTQINRANEDADGAAYCDLLQPSTFFETFTSKAKCARETDQILNQAGRQPELEVESVSVDGDTAKVTFAGRSGEAPFVKEDGRWYLALGEGPAAPAEPDSGGGNGG